MPQHAIKFGITKPVCLKCWSQLRVASAPRPKLPCHCRAELRCRRERFSVVLGRQRRLLLRQSRTLNFQTLHLLKEKAMNIYMYILINNGYLNLLLAASKTMPQPKIRSETKIRNHSKKSFFILTTHDPDVSKRNQNHLIRADRVQCVEIAPLVQVRPDAYIAHLAGAVAGHNGVVGDHQLGMAPIG